MANHERTNPSNEYAPNTHRVEFNANPLSLAPQAQRYFLAQQRILGEIEKFSSGWFQRRQEATGSIIEAGKRILLEGQTDPAGTIREMANWQTRSLARLAQDARGCTEMISICAGALISNEVEAIEETIETSQKATKASKATPV